MKQLGLLGILLLFASLSGCESGLAHLDAADIHGLTSGSIAVVYVDNAMPLCPILSVRPEGEILAYLYRRDFKSKLAPYQAIADRLHDQDLVYGAIRKQLDGVAWLHDASWTRVRKQDDSDPALPFAQEANADAIVVLDTAVCVHSNVDEVSVQVDTKIYTKFARQSHDVDTYRSSQLTGSGYPDNLSAEQRFGLQSSTEQIPDAEAKARLDGIFAGNGALFLHALGEATGSVDQKLMYFFTGTGPVSDAVPSDELR